MPALHPQIKPYHDQYRPQVLAIWESSVLATHNFLSKSDFEEIKKLVESIDFNELQVYCLVKSDTVLGFVGVAGHKIEMLFLDPRYFGMGLGQELLRFSVKVLKADRLDVNEQNLKALKFYQKFGFSVYERTDMDDQGRNYPLLRMKLVSPNWGNI